MFGKIAIGDLRDKNEWKQFMAGLPGKSTHGIFLMIGQEAPFYFDEVQPLFKEMGIPVFGGVFPGIISETSWHKDKVLGCAIEHPVSLQVFRDLSLLDELPAELQNADDIRTFLVIIDGLASKVSFFLELLFETCTRQASYIGGGAGSIELNGRPVLFTADEYFSGGALVAGIEGFVGVGVSHGWEPFYGPLVANRVKGNVLLELNWQPAFLLYKKILEEKTGASVNPGNFFALAKGYPFGMMRINGSIIVRDPIKVGAENSITLVGEVPENSVLMILRGDPENLIKAASEAADKATASFQEQQGKPGRGVFVIDCISRVLFLGDCIAQELMAIRSHTPLDLPMFGFLSLGEVASLGDRFLEFYNKTTVVGVG